MRNFRYKNKTNIQEDEVLGYKAIASSQAEVFLLADQRMIYDVRYSIDAYGRRLTPVNNPNNRHRFALFFGGSHTFGEGVNDHETLPYYFSEYASEYMSYNYGFHGYGPQSMLAKLQTTNLQEEIKEQSGILIYTYLPEYHVARAIGHMSVTNHYGSRLPYYTLDSRNRLMRKGTFLSGRVFISSLYRLLGQFNVINYFDIQFPLKLTAKHYRFTARIIEESQKEFQNMFSNGEFYVLVYPVGRSAKKIFPYLEKAGVKYLDYSELFDHSDEAYHIEIDGHPTPRAYETLAKRLAQDLSH